jgi:16S rRNA (guanine966-N2)-methyltransferase
MRIVAGSARGRTLLTPKDARTTRPTADRVRETLFNVLGQWLEGERVLDLYAGTGALALEALSRGAGHAVLVDQSREAVQLCRGNAERLGFAERCEVLAMPVARALPLLRGRNEPFQLVFADPPYALEVLSSTLEALAGGLVAPGGTVVLEHAKEEAAPERHGPFEQVDARLFGDTQVSLYRLA